eukprot:TRINITY_DN17073_c0_g1_i1.p1 TRINITY_DN17073_c0_g1~~TRINITY_DN17073_c0_g1_i1.p1  ORF type:complete len:303 (-),score=60.49 TRINITY_DN17073_c0_g1_i1:217-1125(-)
MAWQIIINSAKRQRLGAHKYCRAFSEPALTFLGFEEGYGPEEEAPKPVLPKFEEEIPVLYAAPRSTVGKNYCHRLRKGGWTPSVIEPMDASTTRIIRLVPKDCIQMMHTFGYYGVHCTPIKLVVIPKDMLMEKVRLEVKEGKTMENIPEDETYRVLPRIVHINRCGLFVENIVFLNCPRDKIVRVPVQVVTAGEEDSPVKKTGNYVAQVKFWVNVECRGDQIPPMIEVDVSKMKFGDEVYAKDVESLLPEGVRMWRKETYGEELLLKVGGREKKDTSYYQQILAEREAAKEAEARKGPKRRV